MAEMPAIVSWGRGSKSNRIGPSRETSRPGIDVPEVGLGCEERGERVPVERGRHPRVGGERGLKVAALLPHVERDLLHDGVGLLAADPAFDQRQQNALAVHQPAAALEVAPHGRLVHHQPVDHGGKPRQREIEGDGRVRREHPLDGGMADVALVPECDVLERRRHGRAHDAGEAGEVLAQDGVLLVGHGRRALLALAEGLRRLPHLASLQVPDLDREALDRAGDDAEHGEVHRVTIARDDLGRDRLRREPHLRRDMRLHLRRHAREGSDGTGDRAGRDLAARRLQPLPRPGELGIVARELEPEARGLGMDAVAAADAEGPLVLDGAALQSRRHGADAAFEQGAGPVELHREASIEDIGRGEALVDETRLGPHVVREVGEEGDHVVPGLALDRIDLHGIDQRVRVLVDRAIERFRRRRRRLAERDLSVERMALDLQPDREAGLRCPDGNHLRPGIARDHGVSRRGMEPLLTCRCGAWLGRQDSNLGSRDQNPLPYHLATPQARRFLARGAAARKRAG